jgi:hypothetical protein
MTNEAQRRAVAADRRRLAERGMGRYEVRGLVADKALLRNLARRLASNDAGAAALRDEMKRRLGEEPARRGGIVAALRRSPLVGAVLPLDRAAPPDRAPGR